MDKHQVETTQVAPALTNEQRREAAAKSLRLRQARAQVKRQLKAGIMSFNFVLTQDDDIIWMVQGMKIRSLLLALPGVGVKRAEALLDKAGIPAMATVRATGHRQRAALLDALAKR